MKRICLGVFGTLMVLSPVVTVTSCGTTNPYYLAQKELKDFLDDVEKETINLEDYELNQEAQAWIKYLNYLFDKNPDKDNLYQITYDENKLEVSIPVTFLGCLETDINNLEGGRIVKILHVDHFHYRYLTYDEYPPTGEEIEQSNNLVYTLTFKNVGNNGEINWSEVWVTNNFVDLKDNEQDAVIDLSKNENRNVDYDGQKELNLSVDKSIYEYNLNEEQLGTFIPELKKILKDSDEAGLAENLQDKLENNKYYDSNLQYSQDVNNHNNQINLAQATMDLGVDIIEEISEIEDNGVLGYTTISISPDLLNWWLNNKPGAHAGEPEDTTGNDENEKFYTDGLLGLSEDLIKELANISDDITFTRFLTSLEEIYSDNEIKEFKDSIETYKSVIDYDNLSEEIDVKFYYYVDASSKERVYVDEIMVLVEALNEDDKQENDLLSFTCDIESMLTQSEAPTYYVLNNNMIFDNSEDQTSFSDINKLKEYM